MLAGGPFGGPSLAPVELAGAGAGEEGERVGGLLGHLPPGVPPGHGDGVAPAPVLAADQQHQEGGRHGLHALRNCKSDCPTLRGKWNPK